MRPSRFRAAWLLPSLGLLAAGAAPARAEIYATGNARVLVFGDGATGDTAPYHVLAGAQTGLDLPGSLAVDRVHRELFVSDGDRILVFDLDDDGDVAPKRQIGGAATGLVSPLGMAIDPVAGELWVADVDADRIAVFARDAEGDVAPLRTVSGESSKIESPTHVFLDLVHREMLVSNIAFSTSEESVTAHDLDLLAGAGNHDVAPERRLTGALTQLVGPRGIALELASDTLIVADYSGALRFYARTADGNAAPVQVIGGGATGLHQAYDLTLRPDGELLVGTDGFPSAQVVGHALDSTGDAAPVRLLAGASTQLVYTTGAGSDRARYGSEGHSTDGCLFRDNFEGGDHCYWAAVQGAPAGACAVCGDGVLETAEGEVCDDGNTIDETECPYGEASCSACNSTCSAELSLSGPTCGDGEVEPLFETCDDGNASACGTCSASCQESQSAPATGSIVVVAANQLQDGETVTVDDGFQPALAFEFDFDASAGAGNVAVAVVGGDTAGTVATKLAAALNGSGLFVDATGGSALVPLVHQRESSLGNQPILESVADGEFLVSGLAGGLGGDCPEATGCVSDADCASGSCVAGSCAAQP